MAGGLNFDELSTRFDIYAEQSDDFIPFRKNIEASGLLVRRKILQLWLDKFSDYEGGQK